MAELEHALEMQPDHSRLGVSWLGTSRQTMFSDAVFSIVATIMVVTIEISEADLDKITSTISSSSSSSPSSLPPTPAAAEIAG